MPICMPSLPIRDPATKLGVRNGVPCELSTTRNQNANTVAPTIPARTPRAITPLNRGGRVGLLVSVGAEPVAGDAVMRQLLQAEGLSPWDPVYAACRSRLRFPPRW